MPHFRFLDLPYVLREQVYEELLSYSRNGYDFARAETVEKDDQSHSRHEPITKGILYVNRQVYEESRPVLYSCNLFVLIEYNDDTVLDEFLLQYKCDLLKNRPTEVASVEDKIALTLTVFSFSAPVPDSLRRPILVPLALLPFILHQLRQFEGQRWTRNASLTIKINNHFNYTQDRIAKLVLEPFEGVQPLNFLAVIVDESVPSHYHAELHRHYIRNPSARYFYYGSRLMIHKYRHSSPQWQTIITYYELVWTYHEHALYNSTWPNQALDFWVRAAHAYTKVFREQMRELHPYDLLVASDVDGTDPRLGDGIYPRDVRDKQMDELRNIVATSREGLENGIKLLRARNPFPHPDMATMVEKAEVRGFKALICMCAAHTSQKLGDYAAEMEYSLHSLQVERKIPSKCFSRFLGVLKSYRREGRLANQCGLHEIVRWDTEEVHGGLHILLALLF